MTRSGHKALNLYLRMRTDRLAPVWVGKYGPTTAHGIAVERRPEVDDRAEVRAPFALVPRCRNGRDPLNAQDGSAKLFHFGCRGESKIEPHFDVARGRADEEPVVASLGNPCLLLRIVERKAAIAQGNLHRFGLARP